MGHERAHTRVLPLSSLPHPSSTTGPGVLSIESAQSQGRE